jgi:hypothetical protein
LILGYFDESGTHAEAAVTMIAGYVATAEVWAVISEAWASELAPLSDYGINWFHTGDCLHGARGWRRVPRAKRDHLVERLSNILAASEVSAVWAGVNADQWDQHTSPAFKVRFPKPYDLCFHEVVRQLWWWSRHNADGTPIRIVFAEQKEYQNRSIAIHEAWRRHPDVDRFIGSLTFSSPRKLIPLQTADLLAFEANKEWEGRQYGKLSFTTNFQLRPILQKITQRQAMHAGGLYGTRALITAVAKFHATGDIQSGLESLRVV